MRKASTGLAKPFLRQLAAASPSTFPIKAREISGAAKWCQRTIEKILSRATCRDRPTKDAEAAIAIGKPTSRNRVENADDIIQSGRGAKVTEWLRESHRQTREIHGEAEFNIGWGSKGTHLRPGRVRHGLC